jgi:hypothetical protein
VNALCIGFKLCLQVFVQVYSSPKIFLYSFDIKNRSEAIKNSVWPVRSTMEDITVTRSKCSFEPMWFGHCTTQNRCKITLPLMVCLSRINSIKLSFGVRASKYWRVKTKLILKKVLLFTFWRGKTDIETNELKEVFLFHLTFRNNHLTVNGCMQSMWDMAFCNIGLFFFIVLFVHQKHLCTRNGGLPLHSSTHKHFSSFFSATLWSYRTNCH